MVVKTLNDFTSSMLKCFIFLESPLVSGLTYTIGQCSHKERHCQLQYLFSTETYFQLRAKQIIVAELGLIVCLFESVRFKFFVHDIIVGWNEINLSQIHWDHYKQKMVKAEVGQEFDKLRITSNLDLKSSERIQELGR